MTKRQIDLLLKDNDIALSDIFLNEHRDKQHVVDAKTGISYVVSDPVLKVILDIFSHWIKFEVDEGHHHFKTSLENKISLISPLQQDKIEFYRSLIKEETTKLTYLNGGNFYSTITSLVTHKFISIFYDNGLRWIECLKFEILKGKSIQSLKPSDPDLYELEELIYECEMDEHFKMAVIEKNIAYLQILITQVTENEFLPKPLKLSYQGLAILCHIKDRLLYTPTNLDAALNEYMPDKPKLPFIRKKLRSEYDKLKKGIEFNIVQDCTHVNVINERIDQINIIKQFLTPQEKLKAEDLEKTLLNKKILLTKN